MRGRFTPGGEAEEWCERRLLARIHRYTVKRLRAEIEPVAARDFLRFLLRWQRVEAETRMDGPDALEAVIAQLEGFEAPAGAWESEILPARLAALRAGLARRSLPRRPRRLGAASAAQRPPQRRRARRDRRCAPRRSRCSRAAMRRSGRRCRRRRTTSSRPTARRRRSSTFIRAPRRLLLRRARRRQRAVAAAGRGGAGRARGAGPRQPPTASPGLRALLLPAEKRRLSRAQPAARPSASAWRMRDAGRWRAGRGRRRPAPRPRARRSSMWRACPAAPLRRRLLAPARARGRLAAALARPAARLSPARGARRHPRRPLRRGLRRRAIRPAGSDRPAARGAAQARLGRAALALRRRPAQPRRHPDAGREARRTHRQPPALSRRPARSPSWPAARCSSSRRWMPAANGRRARRCCAGRWRGAWPACRRRRRAAPRVDLAQGRGAGPS